MSTNNEENMNLSDTLLAHCKAVLGIAEKVANTPRGSGMTLHHVHQETKQYVIQHIIDSIINQDGMNQYRVEKPVTHFMRFIATTEWWCIVLMNDDLTNGHILHRSHKVESTDLLLEDDLVANSISLEGWIREDIVKASGIYCLGLYAKQYPANLDGEKEVDIKVSGVVPLLTRLDAIEIAIANGSEVLAMETDDC